jgi:hypothetical protein
MLSRPIVDIKRGLKIRAEAARYPKIAVLNRYTDIRVRIKAT